MAASKRGAVYWATLAFGGVFLTGAVGGELIYAKFLKKDRDQTLSDERDEEKKLQKFASVEIEKRVNDGINKDDAEKEIL